MVISLRISYIIYLMMLDSHWAFNGIWGRENHFETILMIQAKLINMKI